MYFDTMSENRFMDVKGKKLKKYFFRSHIYLKQEFEKAELLKENEKKDKKSKRKSPEKLRL